MKKRLENAAPCATCPFLRSNFGRPNPEGYDPKQAEAEHGGRFFDWYSEENLRRLWTGGLSQGEAMICHATDPTAEEYGGKAVAAGCERPCIGALVVVFLHVKYVEALLLENPSTARALKAYRAVAGRFPMSRAGLQSWSVQIVEGRAGGNVFGFGGLTLPASLSPEAVKLCGVPWPDSIVNEGASPE